MLDLIKAIPDQIEGSFELEIPTLKRKPRRLFVAGMGGSGIAGDLVKAMVWSFPIKSVKDYHLPPNASSEDALVAISYSGNTEETLSAYHDAAERGMERLVITSGGKLLELAREDGVPAVVIPSGLPPRMALGWLAGPLALIVARSGLSSPQLEPDLKGVPEFLRRELEELSGLDSPALELANKLYNRLPVVYASWRFLPVAQRWCAEINENAKALAHYAPLPEMNHNEINGLLNPERIVKETWLVFLRFPEDHPRVLARMDITDEVVRDSVMGTSHVEAKGSNTAQRVFWAVLFGDLVSYYLAKAYNVDPIEIPRISYLKKRLSEL